MDAKIQQLLIDNGNILGITSLVLWFIYHHRAALWAFLYSEKWRKYLVRTVTTWNDDLFADPRFRREMQTFIELPFQSPHEVEDNMRRQIDGATIAHGVAEQVLNANDAVHRVLVLRVHNGDKALDGRHLYKVSCVAERTERKNATSALSKLVQSLPIELMAYSLAIPLNNNDPCTYLGVFKSDVMKTLSELQMLPDNQAYRQKHVDAAGMLITLLRGMDGKPLGIIEAHLRYLPNELDDLKSKILNSSTELIPYL